MFRKNKRDDEEFISYQVNDDFISGEDVNWDEYLNSVDEIKNKSNKNNKRKKTTYDNPYEYSYDELTYDFDEKPNKKLGFNVKIFVLCLLYIIFVCFGAYTTTYFQGKPQVINVVLREQRAEFKKVENHYKVLATIVSEIDRLDNEVNQSSTSESFRFAIEYKMLGETVEQNLKEVQGSGYNGDYAFMQFIAIEIYTNIQHYLTLMTNGMSAQSGTYLNQAKPYKEKYLIQFGKYEDNIMKFRKLVILE